MTTSSPSFSFRQTSDLPDSMQLAELDPQEREERQKAIHKLLERAEFSKLTRGLRARLSYATYKATHNISHVPLPVLENRIQTPSPAPSPTPTPPSPSKRRGGPDTATMPPPPSPSRSLYSALLGPPPQKRPRHIYGPALTSSLSSTSNSPSHSPTPADLLSTYSPSPTHAPGTPRSKTFAVANATSSYSNTAGAGGMSTSPFSNATGRTVRTVMQGRARSAITEKEDMNAAATLTALMFTNRASPRQQSQAQAQPGPSLQGEHQHLSVGNDMGMVRPTTPVSSVKSNEDADAAELMLYLATSPSPARGGTSSMPRRTPTSMGRVLFAGEGAASNSLSGSGGIASGSTSSFRRQRKASGDDDMDMDVDKPDRGGSTTPDLSFSQSSQESAVSTSLLAPPPPLRSPAQSHPSLTKPSSHGTSRKLFIDGEDTRRIMGVSMGISTGTYPPSPSSNMAQKNTGNGSSNGAGNSSPTGFTLGKGIDLVEAK
ncbi:hypothetical protein Clacol_002261 [Clathrus columnatus]|uniref:Uncharacterized protein n=1 Tax=Clathrus columnatus TaxID=1419009 RepID=A0AAV5A0C2_9AGAM|nr:hypothetical protein Clacol_002261 [Clathrus columnatus]